MVFRCQRLIVFLHLFYDEVVVVVACIQLLAVTVHQAAVVVAACQRIRAGKRIAGQSIGIAVRGGVLALVLVNIVVVVFVV